MGKKFPEWVKTKEDYIKWKKEWEEGKYREKEEVTDLNKCNACNNLITKESKFCTYCGQPQNQPAAENINNTTQETVGRGTTKQCKYCAMIVPGMAKICPYCNKKIAGVSLVAIFLIGFFGIIILLIIIGSINNQSGTSYKVDPQAQFTVTGKYMSCVSILVPENVTENELENIVYKLQNAKKTNTLLKLIPATTPGGSLGDYGIVWVFIFSERAWADISDLKRFINADMRQLDDKNFCADYINHIRAVYYFSPSREEGSIGYSVETKHSKYYRKLF